MELQSIQQVVVDLSSTLAAGVNSHNLCLVGMAVILLVVSYIVPGEK